jgi:hypothetical protein
VRAEQIFGFHHSSSERVTGVKTYFIGYYSHNIFNWQNGSLSPKSREAGQDLRMTGMLVTSIPPLVDFYMGSSYFAGLASEMEIVGTEVIIPTATSHVD